MVVSRHLRLGARSLIAAVVFNVACSDRSPDPTLSPNHAPSAAALTSQLVIAARNGPMVLTTRDGRPTFVPVSPSKENDLRASSTAGSALAALRRTTERWVDKGGRAHAVVLLHDAEEARSGKPPQMVFHLVDGRPASAMQFGYRREGRQWVVAATRFIVFDTLGRETGEVRATTVATERASLLRDITRPATDALTVLARKILMPEPLYADDGPCDNLRNAMIAADAVATAAVAALVAAGIACATGQVEICFLIPELKTAADLAIAAAAAATA
ncbi:MAG: hypothetical protein ACHQX4_03840, partial [Gemmatimonadales bacterium]